MPGLIGFDQYILNQFIQELSGYKLFFYLLTQLGSSLTLTFIGLLAIVFGNNRLKAFGAVLVIGMLVAIPVIDDVKDIVQRPRPESASGYRLVIMNSYSFPSGHALSIFLAATVLGACFGWKYYAAGYLMAIAVSLSRLYLGVHYPSDILGGAAIGIAMGILLVYAAYRLGLCDDPGLIYYLRWPASGAKRTAYFSGMADTDKIMALALTAIAVSIFLYYLNRQALMLLFIIFSSSLSLYIMLRNKEFSSKSLALFALSSTALVFTYFLLFIGAHALSLLALAISYVSILLMANGACARPYPKAR